MDLHSSLPSPVEATPTIDSSDERGPSLCAWARRLGGSGLPALVVLVAFGVVAAVGVSYAVTMSSHDGRVSPNVSLAGRDVGGLRRSELEAAVDDVARHFPKRKISINANAGGDITTTTTDLGATIDPEATVDTALAVGRGGSLPGRVLSWMWSIIGPDRGAPLRLQLDSAQAYEVVSKLDPGPRKPAVEPGIVLRGDTFVVVPGKNGRGIDPHDVIVALSSAKVPSSGAGSGAGSEADTITVRVRRKDIQPRFSQEEAQKLAAQAVKLTRTPLPVAAGSAKAMVPPATLRRWMATAAGTDDLTLVVEATKALDDLGRILAAATTPALDAGFKVSGSGVSITPAKTGTSCCAPEAADRIQAAIKDRPDRPVELPLRTVEPKRTETEARKLGIVTQVATFTTKHNPDEPRVQNIHRIADLMRGKVISPRGALSVNAVVGARTTEKGFVPAPVIQDGIFDEGVGGGVSQFATTLFNAAFFAGLDFGEYQSHSIAISRYPYGREATLGYPHPDLKIKNPTPYGVLIWPSYTAGSITVSLYSTRSFREVIQSGQSTSPQGTCTVVTTQRRRTRLDGSAVTDTIRARYRPSEGVDCQGRPTAAATTKTTHPPDSPSTTAGADPNSGPAGTPSPSSTTTSAAPPPSGPSSPTPP